jgi:CubicO group peptidase (beta-lactamase class C family)
MSEGYDVASGPAKPFEWVEAAPAGSSSVTAADMQRFIIAHLQNGNYEGAEILRPETTQLMHSLQFSPLSGLNGMALGFYEETRNGHRIIGDAGDTQYFHSDLHLIPDAGIGFFISYNSAGKGDIRAREAVWHAFLDRYFPAIRSRALTFPACLGVNGARGTVTFSFRMPDEDESARKPLLNLDGSVVLL